MNNSKFAKAIAEALDEEYAAAIPQHNGDHVFSESFNKKMDKLIKRQNKPYYKLINTAGKRAACIIAVILIASFSTIMSVDALRNAFKDFFMSIFSTHSEITAIDDLCTSSPDTIQSIYEITYDLNQYQIDYEDFTNLSRNIVYRKDNIYIDYYQYVKSEYNMGLNTENATISTIDINGYEAVYYFDNNGHHNLIWDNGDYVIMISSNIGKSELMGIAKSVQKVE